MSSSEPKTAPAIAPKTIELRYPIDWGGQTIMSLTLRPPTGKDFRGFPLQPDWDQLLALASRLSGQPDPVIDRLVGTLTSGDLGEVVDTCLGFTKDSQPTGNAPSPS